MAWLKGRTTKHNAKGIRDGQGRYFDSTAEYERWHKELVLLELGGVISHLEFHPTYKFQVKTFANDTLVETKKIVYEADSRYILVETGETVVEDVKGQVLDAYLLKEKMMQKVYGITVQRVTFKMVRGQYVFEVASRSVK